MIASVHPFGLESPGGGARILRALYTDAPTDVLSVSTSIYTPPPTDLARELHVPPRRRLGRIDSTRVSRYIDLTMRTRTRSFVRRLAEVIAPADVVHTVAHNGTVASVVAAARLVDKPYFLSIHDDIHHNDPVWSRRPNADRLLADVWTGASGRFAISDALGEEYCRRYGDAPYQVVTDGLARFAPAAASAGSEAHVYFMGLLHIGYEQNFVALLDALDVVGGALTCRCEILPSAALRAHAERSASEITVLPFADEAAVARDIDAADFLYLPLPFAADREAFARRSLSTKLVTYLGTGRPILYHGPAYAGAYELLAASDACIPVLTQDPADIVAALRALPEERRRVSENALGLARERFSLERQRATFWGAVLAGA